MLIQADAGIKADFKVALKLIRKVCDLTFKNPQLFLGSEHILDHYPVSSFRDFVEMDNTAMMYLQELNGIAVADGCLNFYEDSPEKRAERLLMLCHECSHAIISQNNPIFLQENCEKLLNSKQKVERKKGNTMQAFDEGLANYIAIQSLLISKNSVHEMAANDKKNHLVDGLNQRISDKTFKWQADFYKTDPQDVAETLSRHYEKYPELLGNGFEKYSVGYRFFDITKPDKAMIAKLVKNPPVTVRNLLYPLEYIKKIS